MGDQKQVKIFAQRLNLAIEDRGISGRELGSASGISESNISRYRKGYAIPGRGKIMSLAGVLRVSPMWLLGFTEKKDYDLSPEEKIRNDIDGYLERMSLSQLEDTKELIIRFILK